MRWGCAAAIALLAVVGRAQEPAPPFVDRTADVGVDVTHVNGATGELLLPEVIGSGGALFDADNDGDLDLFVVQGGPLPGAAAAAGAPTSRLFRNDLARGATALRFTDVTSRSGLGVAGYGMGATAGDYDNDGWNDLYVTALGSNRLFHNNGDGTFADRTATSRTDDPRWSTGAAFFDYDADGWLDLFVVNYVDFNRGMKRECFSAASARDYCNPSVYSPASDRLFHNNRDGTFADVTARSGVAGSPGRGLGVLAADVDGDGWTDVYVANDGDPNQLWMNQRGNGTFKDDAVLAGVALNRTGQAQGSMGVDLGDVDGDGDEDLVVTNLDNEGNTFYRGQGRGLFEDRTVEAGLFKLGSTGFGARWVDYDNDGWLDLAVANGAVRHLARQVAAGDPYPLKQRNQLFHNERGRRFVEVTERAGAAFAPLRVSRGLASGDLDNDGAIDLVVFNNSGPLRVLMNGAARGRHWLGVRAVNGQGRDALGAVVDVVRGGRLLRRRVHVDGSYAVASDPRLVFGLGDDAAAATVRVQWGGGKVEQFDGLAVDRYWVLEAGKKPRGTP
jgi:enediyne biosynthesis protein E4